MASMGQKHVEIKIFYSKNWPFDSTQGKLDYELLDSGGGEKLERFGSYTFVRPCESAVWVKGLPDKDWARADGKFVSSKSGSKSGWNLSEKISKTWKMEYKGVKFWVSPTSFRHLQFFPEQSRHWDVIEERIKNAGRPIKFLNLFGYTGLASLFALRAGAEVTHVDASKQSLNLAKENQKLSGLDGASMRVIEEDAMKFLEREGRRGNKYDAILIDPPKFGRGPKGETWKIEDTLPKLLKGLEKVLSDKPLFVILNSYASGFSALDLGNALQEINISTNREVSVGELCVLEKSQGRLLALAQTAEIVF